MMHSATPIETVVAMDVAGAIAIEQPDDAYDQVWGSEIPQAEPLGLERFMVEQDKLFVVVAVVLVIWIGLAVFLFRTDRRITTLERQLEQQAPEA